MANDKDKEAQARAFELEMLKQQAGQLEGKKAEVSRRLLEADAAMTALRALRKGGEHSMLVPLGSGVFKEACSAHGDVVVDVGANVSVRKPVAEAVKTVEERKEKFESLMSNIDRNTEMLNSRAQAILGELVKAESSKGHPENCDEKDCATCGRH